MDAGRDMDAAVATEVFRRAVRQITREDGYWIAPDVYIFESDALGTSLLPLPGYSTNVGAAWEVIDFVIAKGYEWHIAGPLGSSAPGWEATVNESEGLVAKECGETVALAICRAALSTIRRQGGR